MKERVRRQRSDIGGKHAPGAARPERRLMIDGVEMTLREATEMFGYNDTCAFIKAAKRYKRTGGVSKHGISRLFPHEVKYE